LLVFFPHLRKNFVQASRLLCLTGDECSALARGTLPWQRYRSFSSVVPRTSRSAAL
jgi:hypothetical protein